MKYFRQFKFSRNLSRLLIVTLSVGMLSALISKLNVYDDFQIKGQISWEGFDLNSDSIVNSFDVDLALAFLGCPDYGSCPEAVITSTPTPTPTPAVLSPTPTPGPGGWSACSELTIGTQIISDQSGQFLLNIWLWPSFVHTGSVSSGAEYYPQLPGWKRALTGGTLQQITNKHSSAVTFGIGDQYECIGYGPESGHQAGDEALYPEVSVASASAIAYNAGVGKCLMYAPATADYEDNIPNLRGITKYEMVPLVAPYVDIWGFQFGNRQGDVDSGRTPVDEFISWFTDWVGLLRSSNPDIKIAVQLGFGKHDPLSDSCIDSGGPEYLLQWRERLVGLADYIVVMPPQPCQPCPPSAPEGFPCSTDPADNQYYIQYFQEMEEAVQIICG